MIKTIKYIPVLFTMLLCMGACDVLDRELETEIVSEEAITDRQSAYSAVNGLYYTIQDPELYGGNFVLANECAAGNGVDGGFQIYWQELASAIIPTSNVHVEDSWVAFYKVINTANSIIDAAPGLTDLDEYDMDEVLGTAYFARGMVYFDLLRRFGEFDTPASAFGVPLITSPSLSNEETGRSSVADTYAQILADLGEAEVMLEDHGDRFYASKAAAQAILARVYLYQKNYSMAEEYASKVIGNGEYELVDNYNDVYAIEGSLESVFELNFTLTNPNEYAINMLVSPAEVLATDGLIDSFDESDTVRNLLFGEVNGTMRCLKYGSSPDKEDANTIVARLSEMYLIRAEAKAFQGVPADGLDDLNETVSRAGLTALTESDIPDMDAFITALLKERRAEFAFEGGHYWFDLARTGRLMEEREIESFRRIFPIPRREMNITAGIMEQNPQY